MNQYQAISMVDVFERKKNTQASLITLGIAGLMLLLVILLKWPLPTAPLVELEDGIEVNIGSSDFGSGTDQPLLPGESAPANEMAYTQTQSQTTDAVRELPEDNDAEAPKLYKPDNVKPDAKPVEKENSTVKTNNPSPITTPPVLRPKAVLNRTVGANGAGGNGADTYKPGTGEGVAGGAGDQGRNGGVVGSPNYTGPGGKGNGAVKIHGNRSVVNGFPGLRAGENLNGKVMAEFRVDPEGNATFLRVARGTNLSNPEAISIIKDYMRSRKFNKAGGETTVTVEFNFKTS